MRRDLLSATEESIVHRAYDVVRRRRVLAAAAFTTVVAVTVTFALYLPDLYKASAIVLVERPLAEGFVKPAPVGDLETRLHVIKQEILSRDRLTALVHRFELYPELRKKTSFEDVLNQTRHDIAIEANGPEQVTGRTKTVSFTLSYTGNNRDTVSQVTNAIAAFYVAENDQMRSDEAVRTTQFLQAQADAAKAQLERQEGTMRSYTAAHASELPQSVGLNLATLERLNTQLRLNGEQQLKTLEQREKLLDGLQEPDKPVSSAAGSAVPSSGPSRDWLEQMRRIEGLKGELVQAEAKYSARYPDVLRLKEQIASLEREAADRQARDAEAQRAQEAAARAAAPSDAAGPAPVARRRSIENVNAELAKLKQEDGELRQAIAATEHRLDNVPGTQQEYALVQREAQAAKDNYDQILRKLEEARLSEHVEMGRQGERFRVLEPALPPEGPEAPNRMRLIIMGVLLALAAAAGAVLAAEQLDTSFHSIDALREFTTLPVLAVIPRIGPTPTRRRVLVAIGTVSAVAAIVLIATLSAYLASGNEPVVRLLARAG